MKVSPLPKNDGINVSLIEEQTVIGQIDRELAAYNPLSFLHNCNASPILEHTKKQVGILFFENPTCFYYKWISKKSRSESSFWVALVFAAAILLQKNAGTRKNFQ